jgi:heme-degrading monooxygenase HmoA
LKNLTTSVSENSTLHNYINNTITLVIINKEPNMFIAMNRFSVIKGSEKEFELIWKNRDKNLAGVSGFLEFHLLRGPQDENSTLYSSHTSWEDYKSFEDWTKSEAFRKTHASAGDHKKLYLGHPKFEGFEVLDDI